MKKTLWTIFLLAMVVLSFGAPKELQPQKIIIVPDQPAALKVTLSLNKPEGSVYLPGELITMTVTTNKDAYIVIYDTEANGRTTILFPNLYQQDNFVKANQPVSIPQGYKLRIGNEIGKEYVQVVANTKQFATYNQWSKTFSASNPFLEATKDAESELQMIIQKIIIVPDTPQPEWNSFSTFFYVGQKPAVPATVDFTSSPSGAQIMLDGNWIQKTTPYKTTLTEGWHFVRYMLAGYKSYEENFYVSQGMVKLIHANLVRETPTVAALNLNSMPSGASVYMDGALKGMTPITIQNIIPGSHVLRLTMRGYQAYEQIIPFATGETKNLTLTLQPEIVILKGTLSLTVNPADSLINLDGVEYQVYGGRVTLSLDAGSHTLTVSKRNYEPQTIPFTITGNQLTTLNVTLAPSRGSMEITSEPEGAAIYINGRDTGYRTSVSGTLTMTIDPGTYEIMLKKDGYQDWIQTMTINPGVNTPLHVTLQPNTAKITITPNVSAVLFIDGKSFGTISNGRTFTHNVLPGNHEILLVKEGYYSFISIFAMEAGETYDFNPYLSLIY